jgi:nitrogen fixation protein
MPGYKLIVKNAKVILKTVTNAVLNISGIKDLLTGSGSLDSNNKIDWTLQEYTNTAANFTSNNPILLLGQKGIETDDLLTAPKFKIGNGVTAWNTLPYANSGGGGGGGVPYTGATANVDLGEYELKAGQIELDQSPTGTAGVAVTRWNDTLGSTETTLKGGSVVLKNGVDLVARVVNKVTPNTTLTKAAYQVVKVSGAQGQRLAVGLAQANNDNNSADTIGVVTETIATNQEGFILTVGQLEGINTTGSLQSETWADGDVLYLSPTVAGAMTNIKPTGLTGHIVVLGYVEYAHAIHGKIYVKIMNGWELDELHNVYINPTTLANNDVLTYESSSSLWKNKPIITPNNSASNLFNYYNFI